MRETSNQTRKFFSISFSLTSSFYWHLCICCTFHAPGCVGWFSIHTLLKFQENAPTNNKLVREKNSEFCRTLTLIIAFLRNIFLYAKAVFGVTNRTKNNNKTFIFERKSFQLNKRRATFKINYLLILLFETKITRANSWTFQNWVIIEFGYTAHYSWLNAYIFESFGSLLN